MGVDVTDVKPKSKNIIGLGDKFRPKDEKGADYWTVVSLTRDCSTIGLYAFTSDKTTRYIPWPEFKDDWVRVK